MSRLLYGCVDEGVGLICGVALVRVVNCTPKKTSGQNSRRRRSAKASSALTTSRSEQVGRLCRSVDDLIDVGEVGRQMIDQVGLAISGRVRSGRGSTAAAWRFLPTLLALSVSVRRTPSVARA